MLARLIEGLERRCQPMLVRYLRYRADGTHGDSVCAARDDYDPAILAELGRRGDALLAAADALDGLPVRSIDFPAEKTFAALATVEDPE